MEKEPKLQENKEELSPEERERRMKILASSYFQMEEGITEGEANKRVAELTAEELEKWAKEGRLKVLDSLQPFLDTKGYLEWLKENHPEKYQKIMESPE